MRSPGKDVCQPQCESVKVLSPEILLVGNPQVRFCEGHGFAHVEK